MAIINNKYNCVLLIDDNEDDSFFHTRAMKKIEIAEHIIVKESSAAALDFLMQPKAKNYVRPDIIFLDINMPVMNGWDFLEKYEVLDEHLQGQQLFMLSSSENPWDLQKVKESTIIQDILPKPLSKSTLKERFLDKFEC